MFATSPDVSIESCVKFLKYEILHKSGLHLLLDDCMESSVALLINTDFEKRNNKNMIACFCQRAGISRVSFMLKLKINKIIEN